MKRREFVGRDLCLLMGKVRRTERIGRFWRGLSHKTLSVNWGAKFTIYYNMEEVKVK